MEEFSNNFDARVLTPFEEESLLDYWTENYSDQYVTSECEKQFKEWKESISWSEVDDIMAKYIRVDYDYEGVEERDKGDKLYHENKDNE